MEKARDIYSELLLSRIIEFGFNSQKVVDIFFNLGNICRESKEYDLSILYFKSALKIALSISRIELKELGLIECALAEVYYLKDPSVYASEAVELIRHNITFLATGFPRKTADKIYEFYHTILKKHNKHLS
mgnify:CR=1 FL=1